MPRSNGNDYQTKLNQNNMLPKDYKIPSTSNYMKFKDGENTFRVLSDAIVGWEYFNDKNKPVRSRTEFESMPQDVGTNKFTGMPNKINHFWAMIVYNYEEKRIQILEIVQATIMEPMQALANNGKWGDWLNYDIVVSRSGTGNDTTYGVVPNPKENLATGIVEAYRGKKINLEALFTGADPFNSEADPMSAAINNENYPPNKGDEIPF